MKLCIKCNKEEVYAPRYPYCRGCQSIVAKTWRENNKERCKELHQKWYSTVTKEGRRQAKLLLRYKLTLEEFNTLNSEQNGVCAICQNPPRGKKTVLCVDHCHTTGKIRGLLCDDCNNMIGRAKDNEMILTSAIVYLNETK